MRTGGGGGRWGGRTRWIFGSEWSRRSFIAYAKTLDPRKLVFLDEAGSHIAMTRDYGRAPRGERVLLKDFGARTHEALDAAIRRGIDLIGADDASAWFTHCGYEARGK